VASAQQGPVEAKRIDLGPGHRLATSAGGLGAAGGALQSLTEENQGVILDFGGHPDGEFGEAAANNQDRAAPLPHPAATVSPAAVDAAGGGGNGRLHSGLSWSPVVHQVANGILAQLRHNTNEAVLTLEPPDLGRLKIELVLDNDHVRAHILAESQDAHRLIQNHLPELKQALQLQHLELVDVRVDSGSWGGASNEFQQGLGQDSTGERRFTKGPGEPGPVGHSGKSLHGEGLGNRPVTNGRVSMWA